MDRRQFLYWSGAAAARVVAASSLWTLGCSAASRAAADRSPAARNLLEPDENGIRLPPGYRSRVLAVGGETVPGTDHAWHRAADGGATFPLADGWVYVSNSERLFGGGVGALRFDRSGRVVDAYSICSDTRRNCAGGATPWGTWLSCEEVGGGHVYECDPEGRRPAERRPALGAFMHEAVAVDPERRQLYLTEDEGDGRLYRFTPAAWERLDAGILEVAEVFDGTRVRWHRVPDPEPGFGATPTRRQVPESTAFDGGEGIVFDRDHVYFTTKGDDTVWDLDVGAETLSIVYRRRTAPDPLLSGVDNITATPSGDLLVAEDGGNMELVLLTRSGGIQPLLRIEGQNGSEIAGPAFDPSGTRLYLSSQRGRGGRGITYEIRGPFPRATGV